MPIYEYQCGACGHQLEILQKMSDEILIDCPKCHKSSLQKLISASGFQLKGSGWYATDYKNKSKSSETNTDSSKADTKADTTTKSSDTKSEGSKSSGTSSD